MTDAGFDHSVHRHELMLKLGRDGFAVDDLELSSIAGIQRGQRLQVGVHLVFKTPHGTCGRVDDHKSDQTTEHDVAEIPAVQTGGDLDRLRWAAFFAELHRVFGRLEVTVGGFESHQGRRVRLMDDFAFAVFHFHGRTSRIAADGNGILAFADDGRAVGEQEAWEECEGPKVHRDGGEAGCFLQRVKSQC